MIGTVLLIGGLLAAGGALLAAFWDELVDFIKRAVRALKALINTAVKYTKVFLKKIGRTVVQIVRCYYRKHYKILGLEVPSPWMTAKTETRNIDISEVPDDIRKRVEKRENAEVDITKDLEMQLAS